MCQTITTYDRFLEACISQDRTGCSYKLVIGKNYLSSTLITVDNTDSEKVRVDNDYIYYFEDFLTEFFHKTFGFEGGDPKIHYLFMDAEEHTPYIMPISVLELFIMAEVLKSKNIPITTKFPKKGKNGKIREIIAPSNFIKPALRKVNKSLQDTYDKRNENFQVAYKKRKSIKSNARPHANKQFCYKIDLHHFFPSCKREQVAKYIKYLFNRSINEEYLTNKFLDLILDNDALYIGNPVSGTLANVIISKPVLYMKHMCDKANISFTVYADDMTFGSDRYIEKSFILDMFNKAFVEEFKMPNFTLSEDKCYGVSKNRRHITGVTINHLDQLTTRRSIYNEIRQTLHQMSYGDTSHYDRNRLKGLISFSLMVDESGKISKLLLKYRDTLNKYNIHIRSLSL